MALDAAIQGSVATDRKLWSDFNAICDCGGRLAGTESERQAIALLKQLGEEATGVAAESVPVPYGGWRPQGCRLRLLGETEEELACHPLVRTASTPHEGLTAEILDIGRGTAEQFAAHAAEIPGRIVLARHEYMFAAGHLHRRRKYEWARERGAAGFMIASPLPGGALVAGSSGRDGHEGIPAIGITQEAAARLERRAGALPRVRLHVAGAEAPATTETLIFDLPGETAERVVLSAHLDGHDLAESAIDNGTGLAVALAVARALAPRVGRFRRGLRLCFFSVEEWALTGSRHYVEALPQAEREGIALNVNLDSVGGSSRLTALTSDYPKLDGFLRGVAAEGGQQIGIFRPTMGNSDHFNFARSGIPALRLVAGFDEPTSNIRHVLTPADTRDKVASAELLSAALMTSAIVTAACTAPDDVIHPLRERAA